MKHYFNRLFSQTKKEKEKQAKHLSLMTRLFNIPMKSFRHVHCLFLRVWSLKAPLVTMKNTHHILLS